MATTPVYALPYQGLTDPPNGPTLGSQLALAAEAELARIDAAAATLKTRVDVLAASPALVGVAYNSAGDMTIGPTTLMLVSVTITAVAGAKYIMSCTGRIRGNTGGSSAVLGGRYATGGTVLPGSSSMPGVQQYSVIPDTAVYTHYHYVSEFVSPSSGSVTVGCLLNFFSGAGTMTAFANVNDMIRIGVTLGIPA